MINFPGTVSADGFAYEWPLVGGLEFAALLMFLVGSLKMYQARRAGHWLRMSLGWVLLLVAFSFGEAWAMGWMELNYDPGMADLTGYAFDLPEVAWWEGWVWWGVWLLQLVGRGLVAFGFFGAAREMVRTALFGKAPKKRKGARS